MCGLSPTSRHRTDAQRFCVGRRQFREPRQRPRGAAGRSPHSIACTLSCGRRGRNPSPERPGRGRGVSTPVRTRPTGNPRFAGVSESRMRLLRPPGYAKTAWLRQSGVPEPWRRHQAKRRAEAMRRSGAGTARRAKGTAAAEPFTPGRFIRPRVMLTPSSVGEGTAEVQVSESPACAPPRTTRRPKCSLRVRKTHGTQRNP
jgi:hypothetical protein